MRKRLRRMLAAFLATGALATAQLVIAAGPAAADYGPGAVYQVEISANNVGVFLVMVSGCGLLCTPTTQAITQGPTASTPARYSATQA
jgi:hypothetical protein